MEEPKRDRLEREEMSRSIRRPESPHEQRPQTIEASEIDDPPVKDGPQLAIQDKQYGHDQGSTLLGSMLLQRE